MDYAADDVLFLLELYYEFVEDKITYPADLEEVEVGSMRFVKQFRDRPEVTPRSRACGSTNTLRKLWLTRLHQKRRVIEKVSVNTASY